MSVSQAYTVLYSASLVCIAILMAVMLLRSARGPGVPDRVLSINMIGTLANAAILVLSALLHESWLVDVALIYTMISFVSVLILARVYIPVKPGRKPFRKKQAPSQPAALPDEPKNNGVSRKEDRHV